MMLKIGLVLLLAIAAFAADVEPGFTPLYNGKDLKGWILINGKGPGYIAKGEEIYCPREGGGNLFTEKEYSNFVLRFEFLLTAGANNGMGIRAPYEGDAAYQGMEIQILDHDDPQYKGWLKPEQRHGSIYGVVAAKVGALKPVGEWNREEILADGRHIKVTLNGKVIVDANLDDVKDAAVLAKHPGLARATGHLGFLGHGALVRFRNLRIQELASPDIAVIDTVKKLFNAMEAKDAAAIKTLVMPGTQFVAIRDGSKPTASSMEKFADNIAASKDLLVEKMWDAKVLIEGPIATLWAPYDFHRSGKFSHCGIDTATLMRVAGEWKIAGLAYTVQTAGCEAK